MAQFVCCVKLTTVDSWLFVRRSCNQICNQTKVNGWQCSNNRGKETLFGNTIV